MSDYIYQKVCKLKKKYKTSDPFEILESMKVEIWDSPPGTSMKGFCFLSNQIFYVSIHPELPEEMRRIVAAHELGHIVLHKSRLRIAMMTDYSFENLKKDSTEYEANLFAAELLLEDSLVAQEAAEEHDFYCLSSRLHVTPSMMSYKLHSMAKRGYDCRIPEGPDSRCLAR